MANKKSKKPVKKKAAKSKIKTDDLPNITFGEAVRTLLKPKSSG